MKIKLNKSGTYSAVLGHITVPLKTKVYKEAVELAKAARLEELDLAHKARLLTASTFQRLSFGSEVTCREALEAFKDNLLLSNLAPLTSHRYYHATEQFLTKHMDKSIQALDEKTVDAFVNPNSDIKAGSRTCRHSAMLSFFRFCNAKGFIVGNPAELIQVRTHDLSHKQMETKEKVPVFSVDTTDYPIFWRVVVAMGVNYGLRLSDVAGLAWESFSDPGKMTIWTDKTRQRMTFALTEEVANLMGKVPHKSSVMVFPEQFEILKNPVKRARLSVDFKRLSGITVHQLRHGFATRLCREGESISDIQRRMGHSSAKTTAVYLHE
jgi:integrase